MIQLVKSSVKIWVKGKPIIYIIFHDENINLDYIVNEYTRTTENLSPESMAEFIRKELGTPNVFTKKEAKQLNIKRSL